MKGFPHHKQGVQGQTGIFQGSVGVFLDNRDPHHGLLYLIHIISILGNIILKKQQRTKFFLLLLSYSVRPGCVVSGGGHCIGCIAYAATVAAVLAYHVAWQMFTGLVGLYRG